MNKGRSHLNKYSTISCINLFTFLTRFRLLVGCLFVSCTWGASAFANPHLDFEGLQQDVEALSSSHEPYRQPTTPRPPKNDAEDINKIGKRNITGKLNFFSVEQEVKMGRNFDKTITKNFEVVTDPEIVNYVDALGQHIGRNSDVHVPLEIKVLRDPRINAMALPGGFFYVFTGMIQFVNTEDELAGVIGHEIAHIAGRHGTRQVSRALLANALVGVAIGALVLAEDPASWKVQTVSLGAQVILPLSFLKFSRNFEKKADVLGVQYMYASGYNPSKLIPFWQRMHKYEQSRGKGPSNLYRSHPPSQKRAEKIESYVRHYLPRRASYKDNQAEFKAIQQRINHLYGRPRF